MEIRRKRHERRAKKNKERERRRTGEGTKHQRDTLRRQISKREDQEKGGRGIT